MKWHLNRIVDMSAGAFDDKHLFARADDDDYDGDGLWYEDSIYSSAFGSDADVNVEPTMEDFVESIENY
jgi:hypothetical protein